MASTYLKILEIYKTNYIQQNRKTKILTVAALSAITAICINYIFQKIYRKIKNYPNGPAGLPIIGCAVPFALNTDKFLKSCTTYGELAFCNIGAQNVCIINSSNLFRQIMSSKYTLDRPKLAEWVTLPFISLDNRNWSERRRIAMKSLITEIKSEWMDIEIPKILINFTFKDIEQCINENKLFYSRTNMSLLAFSSIYYNATGKAVNKNDESIKLCQEIQHWTDEYVVAYQQMVASTFFPYLWFIFYVTGFVKKFNFIEGKLEEAGNAIINERKKVKETNMNDEFESFVDVFMKNIDIFDVERKEMISDLLTLFGAGTDTSQIAAERILILCGEYPNIQNQIFNELQKCHKKNNGKLLSDKYYVFELKWMNQCHKLRAFIHEGIRLSNVLSTGVPHIVNNENGINVKLNDNKILSIPNRTVLFGNFQHIHGLTNNDQNQYENWEKPINKLNLKNWLKNNNQFRKNNDFMMFGYGKRDCLGQMLAIKHLYSIIANILLNYKIILTDKSLIDNIQYIQGLTNQIKNEIGIKMEKRVWT